ncbi:MAG: response regulator transcription factor [Chitinophagaceae bacterium]
MMINGQENIQDTVPVVKRFLLIDDHEIMRIGIRKILCAAFPGCVIEEAVDEVSALEQFRNKPYDLIIADVHMPRSDIFRLMETMRTQLPGSPVLVLSMSAEKIYAGKLIKAGAKGFVSKVAGADELLKAIMIVLKGNKYLSQDLLEAYATDLHQGDRNPFLQLTAREFEVCNFLLGGGSVTLISRLLHISTSTVGTHKARIFEKTRIRSLFELRDLAIQYNLVQP